MSYLLGLDVGTTGVRCVAIDEKGIVQAASSVEHPSYAPRPGWSEQEPEDWWKGSRQMIAQVTSRVGRDIKGIGPTGQMHGAACLDTGDQSITPTLVSTAHGTGQHRDAIDDRQ